MTLFDLHTPAANTCRFPNVTGASGYRYGCRCTRCSDGHRGWASGTCNHPGCTTARVKHRRWCAEHQPRLANTRRVISAGHCVICASAHNWYESVLEANVRPDVRDFYRQVCSGCRRLDLPTIKRHSLDSAWAMRLITADRCEMCSEPFSRSAGGRPNRCVDHRHSCCDKQRTCGRCVRGIVCHRCNRDISGVETFIKSVGLDAVTTYLGLGQ